MLTALRRRLAEHRLARLRAGLTLDAARERAARGAAFLDALDPAWASRVNPGRLQLSDGEACVLGQLHGDYRLGLGRSRVLDLSSAPTAYLSPVDLGFQATEGVGDAGEALDYAHLTRAWRELVTERGAPASGGNPVPTSRRNPASRLG